MLIGIVAKAGSGKSHLSELLVKAGEVVIDVDKEVKEAYKDPKLIDTMICMRLLPLGTIFEDIDYSQLAIQLFRHSEEKLALENILFRNYIFSKYQKLQEEFPDKDIYINGILPRFYYFTDKIIYIETDEALRLKNIRKRNSKNTDIIEKLQKDFPSNIFFK